MTKSKSQLRAEAVERLKEVKPEDSAYQILNAIVGEYLCDYIDYDAANDAQRIIDLLTDDTHESRGSYEERLYDVPVSDCPYCGCNRVVIHDFSDIYDAPHSYRVEHVDEKEAFEAGCFETYYSFDSVEKAVEHANMRDPLNDEPTNGIDGETNGIPSDSPLDAQSRAEIEDAERSANAAESHGDAQRAVLSANTDTDKGEGAKDAKDTREKLEADVRVRFGDGLVRSIVMRLLDRQAAITERECREYEDALREQHNKRIAELNEQLESAHAKNRSLKAHIAKMQEGRHGWHVKYPKLQKKNAELQAKVDELTAERDQYRDNMLAQAQIAGEALAERDMYRENLEAESNRTCTLAYDGKWLVCSECGESLQWFGVRTIYKDGTQERALGVDGVKYCAFCGARIEVDE